MADMATRPWLESALTVGIGFHNSIPFIRAINKVSTTIFGKVSVFRQKIWPKMAKMATKPWLEIALTVGIEFCNSSPFI